LLVKKKKKTRDLLAGVDHAVVLLVLLLDTTVEGLSGLDFLVLLDDGAAAAAAGQEDISEAATLKVVLLADLGTLHGEWDDGETDTARAASKQALS
jgi:hypothetical protein